MSRIVIIEDDPVLRMTFRYFLEEQGYEVRDAENGQAGVAMCRQACPDLVITDMVMPVQEGHETVEILRREFPGVPVIAMSGTRAAEEDERTNDPDAFCYVSKPVEKPVLIKLVDEMLGRRYAHLQGDHVAQPQIDQWDTPHPT